MWRVPAFKQAPATGANTEKSDPTKSAQASVAAHDILYSSFKIATRQETLLEASA